MDRISLVGSLFVVACAGELAHADRPVAVTAGAGLGWSKIGDDIDDNDNALGPAVRIEIGYRVEDHVALGVHLGISHGSASEFVFEGRDSYSDDITYTPLELGLGAQLGFERLSVAPWIGLLDVGRNGGTILVSDRAVAVGLAVGYDLSVQPCGHRFGLYGAAMESGDDAGLRLVSIGVAYRYW